MKSKRRLLKKSRLYLIIDKNICTPRLIGITAKKLTNAGCDIVQLRDKDSTKELILKASTSLRQQLSKTNTIFIVNDHLDIAKITDADGVHLGQGDIPLQIARKILGKDKVIGISCHNIKDALQAQNEGADYISIGPIFPTPLKPRRKALGIKLLKTCQKVIKIPFFAIGGINMNNVNRLESEGIRRVAVCRGILREKNIRSTVKNFKKILN